MESRARIMKVIVPGEGVNHIHGVSYDGCVIWAAVGDRLAALDPATGAVSRSIDITATAGTAFDGQNLYQLANGQVHVIDSVSGRRVREFPAPHGNDCSGMAWSEGSLWIGQFNGRRILEVSPENGDILREIEVGRFVTGVTWSGSDLWHGSWDGDRGVLNEVDVGSGAARRSLKLPEGIPVTGMESDGRGNVFCGAGTRALIHVVRVEDEQVEDSLA